MSKIEKKTAVPKLRFPEFRESDGWYEKCLADCLDYEQPTDYLVSDTKYDDSYKTPVLTAGKTFILGYTNESHGIFKKKLPVIIFDDFTTATQFVDFPFKAKSSAMKILKASKFSNIKFAYELMETISYEVGTHERHWISKFAPMKVFVPDIAEQQKIADCFSSLDELIIAQDEKVEALKIYKKGLFQQLFPQDGKTAPHLTFPEFKAYGDWEEESIGYLFKFKQGVQVPVEDQFSSQKEGMVRFIRIIDITSGSEPPRYISKPNDTHIVAKDDLFIIRYGTPGLVSVGYTGVIANNLFRLIWAGQGTFQSKFWFYAFQRIEKFIYDLSGSSSMPAISFSTLENLPIKFPKNIKEQQKIADCLSAIDELIAAEIAKVVQLKEHKKGLLQQLFPSLDSQQGNN